MGFIRGVCIILPEFLLRRSGVETLGNQETSSPAPPAPPVFLWQGVWAKPGQSSHPWWAWAFALLITNWTLKRNTYIVFCGMKSFVFQMCNSNVHSSNFIKNGRITFPTLKLCYIDERKMNGNISFFTFI